jgi:hypothetical protein
VRRRAGWIAPALALVLVFSGCAQADTDLAGESATQLQSHVVSVAETAATGDYAAAMVELDALQAALDTAREQGDVSDERAATIQAAIDAVRADLVQAVESATPSAPAEAPVEAPAPVAPDVAEPEEGDGNGGEGGNSGEGNQGNGNDGNSGNGNDGNGNDGNSGNGGGNSGNGNGNSGGRGNG